jgi:SAM-dependent methyltransferase
MYALARPPFGPGVMLSRSPCACRPCPVCGSGPAGFAFDAPAARISGHASQKTFSYVACDGCGSVYIAEIPKAEELALYYEDPEYHNHIAPGALPFSYRIFMKLTRPLPKNGNRHLDYGCGPGQYMEFCRQGGWKTEGVEYSDDAAAAARTRYPVVLHSDVPGLPDGGYDYITLLHSLEHVTDPRETLRVLARKLAPDGVMLVEVPYLDCPEFRMFGMAFSMLQAPVHLQFFSDRAVSLLAQNAGLEVTRVRNDPWSPTHWTWSLMNRFAPDLSRMHKRRIYLIALPLELPLSMAFHLMGRKLSIRQYYLRRAIG